jgi:hypothetical protein
LLGTALFGIIAWAVKMSNRVAVLESDKVSLKELLEEKLENIVLRLVRIERKVDKE